METNEFDAVFLKSYHELSTHEREEMRDMFTSEEEFLQMKMVLQSIQESIQQKDKVVQPSVATKQRLDHLFHQTYQNKGVLWYNSVGTFFINPDKNWHQQNILRIAAILLVGLLALPFLLTDVSDVKPNLAQLEKKKDTALSPKMENQVHTEEKTADLNSESIQPLAFSESMDEAKKNPGASTFMFDVAEEEQPSVVSGDKLVVFSESEETIAAKGLTNHPDGIFKDDAFTKRDIPQFNVKDNQFILDFITATY